LLANGCEETRTRVDLALEHCQSQLRGAPELPIRSHIRSAFRILKPFKRSEPGGSCCRCAMRHRARALRSSLSRLDKPMNPYTKSSQILDNNRRYIPGGVVSTNRAASPEIVFARAECAYLWDAESSRYIDYHAAFAPHFLGHNDPYVTEAVRRVLEQIPLVVLPGGAHF
jgi:hypothetical protein